MLLVIYFLFCAKVSATLQSSLRR